MTYVFHPYPAYRYRYENPESVLKIIVNNAEEDAALGPGWYKSPADVKPPEEVAPEPEPKPRKHRLERFDPFKENE